MKSAPLDIILLGFSDKNRSTFEFFFKKHLPNVTLVNVIEINPSTIIVVDYDNMAAKEQWQVMNDQQRSRSIIVAQNHPSLDGCFYVDKPVTGQHLKQAIKQILKSKPQKKKQSVKAVLATSNSIEKTDTDAAQEAQTELDSNIPDKKNDKGYKKAINRQALSSVQLSKKEINQCCGQQADVDLNDPNASTWVRFHPERTLIAPLKKAREIAIEQQCYVELEAIQTSIVVLPGGDEIYIDIDNRIIRHLCAMPLQKVPQIHQFKYSQVEFQERYPEYRKNNHNSEEVLWKMALWTSHGRLPAEFNIEQKMHLQSWPNLTRLQRTPHAIQIVAMLNQQAVSVRELLERLPIAQRYIFAVISACHINDLLEIQTVKEETTIRKVEKKAQGIIASILRSLHAA